MGNSWGRGAECSLCCHWPERARESEREREREWTGVPYVEKKHSSAHTSLVCSRDYRAALRSDGGHAGMNR